MDTLVEYLSIILLTLAGVVGAIVGVALSAKVLRQTVWFTRYPFLILNYLLWLGFNPWRSRSFDRLSKRCRQYWIFSPIRWGYWLFYWVISLPLRIIQAIYFNGILLGTMCICDHLEEVLHPKLKRIRNESLTMYLVRWIKEFGERCAYALWGVMKFVAVFILILPIDILIPHFTMYHGTDFENAGTDIMSHGRWKVGGGMFAGEGVYLAIRSRVAKHYSGKKSPCVILCRCAILGYRDTNSLPTKRKQWIGGYGKLLTREFRKRYSVLEHWRDNGWFEYCYLNTKGGMVSTWRIRPIAYHRRVAMRTWGGSELWCGGMPALILSLCLWGVVIALSYYIHNITDIQFEDFRDFPVLLEKLHTGYEQMTYKLRDLIKNLRLQITLFSESDPT